MDPYVVIKVEGKELRTKTVDDGGKTPVWNQDFDINLPDKKRDVIFQVYDAGALTDTIIGEVTMPLESVLTQKREPKEIEIKHAGKTAGKVIIMSSVSELNNDQLAELAKQLALKDNQIKDLESQLKKSEMEKTIARSLMDKVKAKLQEEEAARVQLTNKSALTLAEEQIAFQKKLQESEKRLEELRQQQSDELEKVRLHKDAEAKTKLD